MAGSKPWLKSAFQGEMRTLVFIFSAQSNRIITNKFRSTKMSHYFAVQNRKLGFFRFFMMNGSLKSNMRNWKSIFSSIKTGSGMNNYARQASSGPTVSLCGTAFRFH